MPLAEKEYWDLKTKGCKHAPDQIAYWETGGSHFSGGEYWDDVTPHWICKVCGKEFDKDPYPARVNPTIDPTEEIPF